MLSLYKRKLPSLYYLDIGYEFCSKALDLKNNISIYISFFSVLVFLFCVTPNYKMMLEGTYNDVYTGTISGCKGDFP